MKTLYTIDEKKGRHRELSYCSASTLNNTIEAGNALQGWLVAEGSISFIICFFF